MINTINILDEYIYEQELKKNSEKVMSSHHPSGASSCIRQLYYKWTNEPISNPVQPKDIWRMKFGTALHKMYAELLQESGIAEVMSEVEITYTDPRLEYPIHGFMDNVFAVDEETYSVELKTVFGYGAKAIQLSGQPRDQDLIQMKIYLSVRRDLDHMLAPYIARDSFYRTEFCFTMTQEERDEFIEGIVQKFIALELAVKNKSIPDREYDVCVKDGEIKDSVQHNNVKYKSDWQCLYCQYRSTCWEEEIFSVNNMHLPMDKGTEVKKPIKSNHDDECTVE